MKRIAGRLHGCTGALHEHGAGLHAGDASCGRSCVLYVALPHCASAYATSAAQGSHAQSQRQNS